MTQTQYRGYVITEDGGNYCVNLGISTGTKCFGSLDDAKRAVDDRLLDIERESSLEMECLAFITAADTDSRIAEMIKNGMIAFPGRVVYLDQGKEAWKKWFTEWERAQKSNPVKPEACKLQS